MTVPSPAASRQLVVVGSSAGGIEALSMLVSTLGPDFPAPLVLAQHLDPRRLSHLGEILARHTPLAIRSVAQHEKLEAGVIYVVPANRHVEVTDDHLRLREAGSASPKPSIDLLFSSAAEAYGEGLIAVILTGLGSDGAAGAHLVKQAGGTVVVQSPATAAHPAMPQSLAPVTVDIFADLPKIGPLLRQLLGSEELAAPPDQQEALKVFLEQIRARNGIDFTTYKVPTIARRLQRRIAATGTETLIEYLRYLEQHEEEYQRLISSFLIKVTGFFRDPELYEHLRTHVLPELIAAAGARDHSLRIWSAGCATGEETFSLAILVSELLGERLTEFNVRILATDLDADAVSFARRAVYPSTALKHVPNEMVAQYFTKLGGEYAVNKQVRDLIVFGQHDLGQRAPFPRVDLILCRNVLIYFTAELQRRALQLFAFSLRDGGYLALGKTETSSPLPEYFEPTELPLKVYRRVGGRSPLPVVAARLGEPQLPVRPAPAVRPRDPKLPFDRTVRGAGGPARPAVEQIERFFAESHVGAVIVDRRYDILMINGAARGLFGVHSLAVGEDFLHLVETVPAVPLRAAIDAVFRGEAPQAAGVLMATEPELEETSVLQVTCFPYHLASERGGIEAVMVLATDATAYMTERREREATYAHQERELLRLPALAARLEDVNRQLLESNQELTRSNVELQTANEDLLLANEEAQAATEEIETLNEELQATNEELETLNEELQATVEELNTTNEDLQARGVELQNLADSLGEQRQKSEDERLRLEAILVSMGDAVLVVDRDGTAVLTNLAFRQAFGEDGAGLVPETESGVSLPPDSTPQQRAAHGESFNIEFTISSAGSRRWYEASGRPGHSDGLLQGVVVIRDITERSLRRLQDEFLAMAGHELRTPLTALQASLQMLTRLLPDGDTGAAASRYARIGYHEARRLARLVNDLLDVSRLQGDKLPLQLAPVELTALLQRTADVAAGLVDGQEIILGLDPPPIIVSADAGRIEQVILNLLSNAIKYAPGTDRIELRLRSRDGEAVIEVDDAGMGIPAAELDKIFSRFYQVSRRDTSLQRGLGLGLFIARQIVIGHGGRIEVASTEGQGTTFRVHLPLLAEANESPRASAAGVR